MNEQRKSIYNPIIIGVIILEAVVAYGVFPIDIISDFFVGIGQIDDAIIIILGLVAEIANAVCGAIISSNQLKASDPNAYYDVSEYGSYQEVS